MEIKVRKPKEIRILGLRLFGSKFYTDSIKYEAKLPNTGDRIRITWLPNIKNGLTNPYIGMHGIVERDGELISLNCDTNILLLISDDFNYIKL